MKIKIFGYIFFAIIIILLISAVYIIYNNKQLVETNKKAQNIDNILTGNITIGLVNFDSLNPHISQNQDTQYLSKLIFKDLIGLTKDFKLEPSLAEEWSKIGNKIYIIKLKENLQWSNGEILTTDDVQFTINQLKKEESNSLYKENVKNIEKIEKIDKLTMKIYLYEEEEFFEYKLCLPILYREFGNSEEIIGNGDYKIVDLNEKYILLQNNTSHKKIKIILYKNYSDLYSDFSKKKIDIITTYNTEFNQYVGTIGIKENKIIGRKIVYIKLNKENQKLEDINLRQTIQNVINKDEIVYNVYNNKYVKTDFFLNYGSYLEYKHEHANNTSKNYNLTLSIDVANEEQRKIAEELKKQLIQTGITINIIENSEEVYSKKLENNNYEMIICQDTLSISPIIKQYINLKNNEIDKLYNSVKSIEDLTVIKEIYSKILEINEKEVNNIYLVFNSIIILHNSNIKGDFTGNWYNILYNIDTWYKEL